MGNSFTSSGRHLAHTREDNPLLSDSHLPWVGNLPGEDDRTAVVRWHKDQGLGEGSLGGRGLRSGPWVGDNPPWVVGEEIGSEHAHRSIRVVGFGLCSRSRPRDVDYTHEVGLGDHNHPWEEGVGVRHGWENGICLVPEQVHQVESEPRVSDGERGIFMELGAYVCDTLHALSLKLAAIELLDSSSQVRSGLELDESISSLADILELYKPRKEDITLCRFVLGQSQSRPRQGLIDEQSL